MKNLKSSTQIISLVAGLLLFLTGLMTALFKFPGTLHLPLFHSIILSLAGAVLFYNGYRDNDRDSFMACLCFGIFFALHSVAGLAFNFPAPSTPDQDIVRIIPHINELGTADHIFNGVVGLILLGGALDWWRIHRERRRMNRHDRRRHHYHHLAHR